MYRERERERDNFYIYRYIVILLQYICIDKYKYVYIYTRTLRATARASFNAPAWFWSKSDFKEGSAIQGEGERGKVHQTYRNQLKSNPNESPNQLRNLKSALAEQWLPSVRQRCQ